LSTIDRMVYKLLRLNFVRAPVSRPNGNEDNQLCVYRFQPKKNCISSVKEQTIQEIAHGSNIAKKQHDPTLVIPNRVTSTPDIDMIQLSEYDILSNNVRNQRIEELFTCMNAQRVERARRHMHATGTTQHTIHALLDVRERNNH
jgi:hypothetical protein